MAMKEGNAMTRRSLALLRRLGAFAVLAGLALTLSGDRTSAATVPAAIYGQDPLEVLELKVKPNVILVFDSSASMQGTLGSGGNLVSGDHPRTRNYQGKKAISDVVKANQDKVSFQFGTYTAYQPTFYNQKAGWLRFEYYVDGRNSAFMNTPATELAVRGATGGEVVIVPVTSLVRDTPTCGTSITVTVTTSVAHGFTSGQNVMIEGMSPKNYGGVFSITVTSTTKFTYTITNPQQPTNNPACSASLPTTPATGTILATLGRGLQSWQIIYPEWSVLYFGEDNNVVCKATIQGTPRFYKSGSDLATDLQNAMNNSPSCTGTPKNKYTVRYAPATGVFSFAPSPGYTTNFQIRWADAPQNIAGALGKRGATNTSPALSTSSGTPYTLLYRATGFGLGPTPFTDGMDFPWTFQEKIPSGGSTNVRFFQVGAGRFWNGETIRVTPTGEACGMDFAAPLGPGVKTNPASITIQAANTSCSPTGNSARFDWAGGAFRGTNNAGMGGCGGFRSRSDLVPCDLMSPPAPLQFQQIGSLLENEMPLDPTTKDPKDFTTNDPTGVPGQPNYLKPDGKPDYREDLDGSWTTSADSPTVALLQGTIKIRSNTPLANTLLDLKGTANAADTNCVVSVDPVTDKPTVGPCPERGFTKLWNQGQVGTKNMAGPPPWELTPIKNHGVCPDGTSGAAATCPTYERTPKEKTIVLFVTDGEDDCGPRPSPTGITDTFTDDQRRSAYYAAELYRRIDPLDSASSVTTYMIGFGDSINGLDWIAWGGSGLGQQYTGQAAADFWGNSTATQLKTARAQCATCTDAFIAPDAQTLTSTLQALIDRGAGEGEFNAQQSITESVFEYVHKVSGKDAAKPSERYNGIVPTRFLSTFTLPGFKGHVSAYQSDGANPPNTVLMWDAGTKLMNRINMTGCATQGNTDLTGTECVFSELHGGETDATIEASTKAKIKRRIYTTTRNGVYTFDADKLMAGTSTERLTLWPPTSTPVNVMTGGLDTALGLPLDSPTTYPPGSSCASPTTAAKCWNNELEAELGACTGTNLPAGCGSTTTTATTKAEARQIILAFLAGATPALDPGGTGLKRVSTGSNKYSIFFKKRDWILADAELAAAAVMTPPNLSAPGATPYVTEYKLFRDGTRNASGKNADSTGTQIRQGFGLTQPDNDQTVGQGQVDTRVPVKPVMTVVYAPANDGLHAFRAGPCDTPGLDSPSCAETGGEELWSFVPYDQLNTLLLRAANEPQGRASHVYSLASGVRFTDVFVPTPLSNKTVGGVAVSSQGLWRRVLFFGRGIGGKYVTALDVTGPGPYTSTALSTTPPIPLWSRGNPDTQNGQTSGTYNHDKGDYDAYRHMGETWSMPTVAYVKPLVPYATSRRSGTPCPGPSCIDFVLFMGSGYGDPATYGSQSTREGTTHYTLDALYGDVIAAADVGERSGEAYPNAIVANSVSFNRSAFESLATKAFNTNPHQWNAVTTRVYVGDVHGRLWKFLVEAPGTAIPVADFGTGQPIGTAVALLGEPNPPESKEPNSIIPNIFVTTGADKRAAGPFVSASLLDAGTDTDAAWTGPVTHTTTVADGDGATVSYFPPVQAQFTRFFAEGTPEAKCADTMPKAVFRGTIQPTSAVECNGTMSGGTCSGTLLQRVFFGGTRLSLPATMFAPPTPLACDNNGAYPCRSQFDSILYALGVETGEAAYDLNSSTDDAYRIFRDSRIAAISFQADPNPGQGGSRFAADEGLIKGVPKPPPPPGVPPTTTVGASSVTMWGGSGQPQPVVQYGSTVCR
jgi:hypothetical protein